MNKVTFKGNPVQVSGALPAMGKTAPAFKLTNAELADVGLDDFAGKRKIVSIVPSLDTGVCAMSAKKFNAEIAKLENALLINVSADLPFAQKRFCESEKLNNIVTLSVFRAPQFARDYGVAITGGPLAGLLTRAVVVLDEHDQVVYTELVPEITQEPNYAAALKAVKG